MVKNSFLCKILRVNGITLYPFVFVREKRPDMTLVNHERIHYEQARRVGVLRFYVLYLGEYFQNRLRGMGHREAYREISFEKEAFLFQDNPEDLFSRSFY